MSLNRVALFIFCCISICSRAQSPAAIAWADSVLQKLTAEQRIAQLMVMRSSAQDDKGQPVLYTNRILSLVKQYNIGGICAFQGTPQQHAALFNSMQAAAPIPVMITVDAEWGLGMRFAGVQNFPYQLTIGAIPDAELAYKVGRAIGAQCRRMNIHVNYAPVVDINNNPNNPVIGVRSFGENKYKVALLGTRMMEGLQDAGVMACAKHFPGHGDVAVDSHYDLPVINKSRAQLDSLELYPFQQLFKKGVGSVMVAHLFIPAIDTTPNRATSLSYNNITKLMRNELGYKGLTFTDALEMKGVAKFYPNGEAAVQSLIAGNDMLCLPADVRETIDAVKKAIAEGRLTQEQLNEKCKKVLQEKYKYVLGNAGSIDTSYLTQDLNKEVAALRRQVAEKAITVLRQQDEPPPLKPLRRGRSGLVYVLVGNQPGNTMAGLIRTKLKGRVLFLPLNAGKEQTDSVLATLEKLNPAKLIIGVHGLSRSPAKNFGLGLASTAAINKMGKKANSSLLVFGNPYAIRNFDSTRCANLVACYEDDSIFQQAAFDWLTGRIDAVGTLPVTVGQFKYGSGIVKKKSLAIAEPETVGLSSAVLKDIDVIAEEAVGKKATPGCVVTVVKNNKLIFQKSYGSTTYDSLLPLNPASIFDLASVTKISATTLAVMKLYEEGRLDLKAPVGAYLAWLKGTDKESLTCENLLMHQAGLNPFIPFFKEVLTGNKPDSAIFSSYKKDGFEIPVTESWYMRNDWADTMLSRIKTSELNTRQLKYVYSDNDFILLGKIVEAIGGQPLDEYVADQFYKPLGLASTGFKAFNHFPVDEIAPTEKEKQFRCQQLWGYVHDPGAAMFGNVAGHAGLFSNATDLAILFQMLLNGGEYNGKRYLKKETIDWFTSYQSAVSRRGMGFDKPEKDNAQLPADKAYPCKEVSAETYGHTGYTGIGVWIDPRYNLIYLFFSNRVYPDGGENNKLSQLNIRSRIQEVIYKAMLP